MATNIHVSDDRDEMPHRESRCGHLEPPALSSGSRRRGHRRGARGTARAGRAPIPIRRSPRSRTGTLSRRRRRASGPTARRRNSRSMWSGATCAWLTASPESSVNFTPLHELDGIITPNGLCFERHHGGIAEIDPADHRLMINGLVDKPLVFTMDDIKRMPARQPASISSNARPIPAWSGAAPSSTAASSPTAWCTTSCTPACR